MTTKVEKSILVNVPVGTAYNQWTQFEDFPHFMGGVNKVEQINDSTVHWVAEIGGVKREWDASILEQIPDKKVAWAATRGATNAGAVYFEPVSINQTSIRLELEYEPEGMVEKIGDKLNFVERQAEGDLERFKTFIEDEGYSTGAWRGSIDDGMTVGTPGIEDAASSQGDSGKAGVSAKAVAAGAAVVGAGVAAAVAAKSKTSKDAETELDVSPGPMAQPVVDDVFVEPVLVVEEIDVVTVDPLTDEGEGPMYGIGGAGPPRRNTGRGGPHPETGERPGG